MTLVELEEIRKRYQNACKPNEPHSADSKKRALAWAAWPAWLGTQNRVVSFQGVYNAISAIMPLRRIDEALNG